MCICTFGDTLCQEAPIPLTLSETIFLALENNRDLKNAYLGRRQQEQQILASEEPFRPRVNVQLTSRQGRRSNTLRNKDIIADEFSYTQSRVTTTLQMTLQTGAQINFQWLGDQADQDFVVQESSRTARLEQNFTQGVDVEISQPLLRGAGSSIAEIPVRISELEAKKAQYQIQEGVMQTVTAIIFAYRRIIQADKQIEIEMRSLQQAEDLLSLNQSLIKAGRIPKVDRVQSEAEVARREIGVLIAKNERQAAQLALIRLVDISEQQSILPTESALGTPKSMNTKDFLKSALENRPDYQSLLLDLQVAKLRLQQSQDAERWDLSLNASYGLGGTDDRFQSNVLSEHYETYQDDWSVGVNLSQTFGDTVRHSRTQQLQFQWNQLQNSLIELKTNIQIEIKETLREVHVAKERWQLAQTARELAERQLSIEQEKLKVGRSSNFQMVAFQNDLVSAQKNELDALIAYNNSLSVLDQVLGSTLNTWSITIDE